MDKSTKGVVVPLFFLGLVLVGIAAHNYDFSELLNPTEYGNKRENCIARRQLTWRQCAMLYPE